MKKIFLYIPLIALFLASCDPLSDVYSELDEAKVPYKEAINYTLTSADYKVASKAALAKATNKADSTLAKSIESSLAFNTTFTANDYVGTILSTNFPALNKNSVAKVTYNYSEGTPAYLSDLVNAESITLTDNDYINLGGVVSGVKYFVPSQTAGDNLPFVLAAKVNSPAAGKLVYVSYKSSSVQPTNGPKEIIHYTQNFSAYTTSNTDIGKLSDGIGNIASTGTKKWYSRSFSGNYYAQFTSFGTASDNVVWMLTPTVDLAGSEQNTLSFEIVIGYWNANTLEVLVSSDYTGDVNTATWQNVTSKFTIPSAPASGYSTMATAGTLDVTGLGIKNKLTVAFKYTGSAISTPVKTTTVQIDNILIKGITYASKSAKADYVVYNDIYEYNGSAWKLNTAEVLDITDYNEMGSKYANFSSTFLPANYLSKFLAKKFPYALEGTKKAVVYDYFSSTTSRKADEYTLNMGVWTLTNPIKSKSSQFLHTGEKWIFDPTIKLAPSSADYQLVVDYVYANLSRSYGSSFGNDEFYYGFSAYYLNLDLRLSNKATYKVPGFEGLSAEEGVKLAWKQAQEGLILLLTLKYPEAQTDVSGVPVYYWITFATYENDLSKNTYTGVFKCTKAGPNPTFERATDIEDQLVASGDLTANAVKWNR